MEIKIDVYEKNGVLYHETITEEDIIRWWKEENLMNLEKVKVMIDKVIV